MKTHLFLFVSLIFFVSCHPQQSDFSIMTVNGEIAPVDIGKSLIHEHILVDFIGADSTGYHRWNKQEVMERVLPFLEEIKAQGVKTFVDCTPAYLGRDPILLRMLADESGLQIITNTGYYGALNNKYLPEHAYTETADQLAARWISEWKNGIEDTGVRPGFIKTSVESGSLSALHQKLIQAAAKTHLQTGLTIASHTGLAVPAFEQMEILENEGVSPEAFIWVHAQSEKDLSTHIKAANKGCWISLDGLNENQFDYYIEMLKNLKKEQLLYKVLISHDAGWYTPGEKNGGDFKGFTLFYEQFLPKLKEAGFTDAEIRLMTLENPMNAFSIRVREMKAE